MLVISVRYSGLGVAHWVFILSAEYWVKYCIVSVWGWQRRTLSFLSKKLFPSPPKAYLSHQVILTTIAIAHTSHSADQNGQKQIQSNNTYMYHFWTKKARNFNLFHQIVQWHAIFLHRKKLLIAAIFKLPVLAVLS